MGCEITLINWLISVANTNFYPKGTGTCAN